MKWRNSKEREILTSGNKEEVKDEEEEEEESDEEINLVS